MRVVVEFYRLREEDEAHAVVGREIVEGCNLEKSIILAWELSQTLNMPQRPDAMSILDDDGKTIYSVRFTDIEKCR